MHDQEHHAQKTGLVPGTLICQSSRFSLEPDATCKKTSLAPVLWASVVEAVAVVPGMCPVPTALS
jgi:hypothetical protein